MREIAARHGLKVDIDPTPGQAGQEHTQDFAHLVDNDSHWNTIAALAQREGAFLYVSGDTLYFKRAGNDGGLGTYSVFFTPPMNDNPASANVIEIDLFENVHLAGGVTQTTRSYRTREEQAAETRRDGAGADGASPLAITEHLPGLTDAQVDANASRNQIETERHQMQVDVLIPGGVNINVRQILNLIGTSSAWDQGYFMDMIHHSFSAMSGYTMRIDVNNKRIS